MALVEVPSSPSWFMFELWSPPLLAPTPGNVESSSPLLVSRHVSGWWLAQILQDGWSHCVRRRDSLLVTFLIPAPYNKLRLLLLILAMCLTAWLLAYMRR